MIFSVAEYEPEVKIQIGKPKIGLHNFEKRQNLLNFFELRNKGFFTS